MRGQSKVGQEGQVGRVGSARRNLHVPPALEALRVLPSPAKPEVESDDPFQAVAMQLPSPPGFDAMGEMARCMVEEYAMMGFSAELLLKMFKNPFYQALHRVYETRGEEYVQGLLDSVFRPSDRSDRSDGEIQPNSFAPQSAIRNPQSEIRNPGAPHA